MERQKFEESWREAFRNAEADPSDNAWMNIALDLERAESGRAKRSVLFYKMVAAASIIIGVCIGGTGVYLLRDSAGEIGTVAQNGSPADADKSRGGNPDDSGSKIIRGDNAATSSAGTTSLQNESALAASASISMNKSTGTEAAGTESGGTTVEPAHRDTKTKGSDGMDGGNSASTVEVATGNFSKHDKQMLAGDGDGENKTITNSASPAGHQSGVSGFQNQNPITFKDRNLPPLVKAKKIEPHFPKREPTEFDLLLAKWELEQKEEEKKTSNRERLWTSVALSAGAFNPVGSGTSVVAMADAASFNNAPLADNALKNETEASGLVYSAGLQVGGSISERWVVQGGLNYFIQSSEYVSNVVVESQSGSYVALSSNEVNSGGAERLSKLYTTAPHHVNNSIRFLSVPVQAGFRVINRSFGLQLNGGVSTDLFIQNTVTPQGGSLDKVTTGRGDESPYRPINFSGLFSTEFSYRFTDRYRLAVNPGIRYPFSSIYKPEVGLQSTPVTFDVGLKFHYIFE